MKGLANRWCMAAFCLIVWATPGCKGSGGTGGGAVGGTKAAPVGPPREAMRGVWTADVEALARQENFQRMPEQQRALALDMARSMMTSMRVEFTADAYSITMGGKALAGRYTIEKEDGPTLVLATVEEDGTADQMTLRFDGPTLILHASGDEALPLQRVETPAAAP
ncbi:MAG: hypothetical protein KC620_24025 [Myxococcales bacterium]|nr:hypothetical protein [Myxococcales bacterium]